MEYIETGKLKGISLCMITKNEAMNPAGGIEAFLKHHLPMVDEVVLVDTGSKDRTAEIARAFPKVRTFDYQWDNSFSNARNFSLEQATYDHILVLDADEKLLLDGKSLVQELPTAPHSLFGYEFVFIDIPQKGIKSRRTNHGDGEWYDHRVRYFMNLPCLRFEGVVHEQLADIHDVCMVPFVEGHVEIGIIVQHYLPSEDSIKEKENFYERLMKQN